MTAVKDTLDDDGDGDVDLADLKSAVGDADEPPQSLYVLAWAIGLVLTFVIGWRYW